jgi:poly(3-hydroxybutyrate) depolymerase/sugar lactone lactonase YvrE
MNRYPLIRFFTVLLLALLFGSIDRPAAATLIPWEGMVDGVRRTALIEPGKDATITPSPLVFVFHGGGGTSSDLTKVGLSQAWPEATFVYPQGRTRINSIAGGAVTCWQSEPGEYDDQDMHFVDALLDTISPTYRVDPRRVYATGFSNGGAICYLLLTLHPERFAAFALVSGRLTPILQWARVPRPVLIVHGSAESDQMGTGISLFYAEWARNQLLRLNGCSFDAAQRTGSAVAFQSCASGQPIVWFLHGGDHFWPMEATANVVQFFKEQSLPAVPPAAVAPPAVDASGTAAGSGRAGFAGDGASATTARLLIPEAVAVDALGGLLLADTGNQRVRRVGADGTIQTVAGRAQSSVGQNPDREGIVATGAHLFFPEGIVADHDGSFYIADTFDRVVRKVTATGLISTVAGKTSSANRISYSGDGGPGPKAQLSFPTGVALDSTGNLFIADTENHRIRKLGPDGVITTVAGTGSPGFSGDGGPATQAQLNEPWGLAADSQGALFIADTSNHRIRKVAPDGTITTVAGNGARGFSGDGGQAPAAQFYQPCGVAADSQGNLFIVDRQNHRIRKVASDGVVSTVFGGVREGESEATTPRYYPSNVAIDKAGDLLIADPLNHRVWRVAGIAAPGLLAGQPFP